MPLDKLYSWLRKQATRPALVHGAVPPERRGWPSLSVVGPAEAHTAHALRTRLGHRWSMHQLLDFAERARKLAPYPLAVPKLVTDGIDAFVEHDDELSRLYDGQTPLSEIGRPYLTELVPWDDELTGSYRPPELRSDLVEIDPRFNGGRMSFVRNRVPLSVVVGAMSAGDSAADVQSDYRLTDNEVDLVEQHVPWLLQVA